MVDSIAARPLIIGNSVATLNPNGSIHIKNPDGEKDVSDKEFLTYLNANVPKINTKADMVSFKGEDSGGGGGETSGSVALCRPPEKHSGPTIMGAITVGCAGDLVGHYGVFKFMDGKKLSEVEDKFANEADEAVKQTLQKSIDKLKSTRTKVAFACAAGAVALYAIGKMITGHKEKTAE